MNYSCVIILRVVPQKSIRHPRLHYRVAVVGVVIVIFQGDLVCIDISRCIHLIRHVLVVIILIVKVELEGVVRANLIMRDGHAEAGPVRGHLVVWIVQVVQHCLF